MSTWPGSVRFGAFAVGDGLSALSVATAFGIGVDTLGLDRPEDTLPGVESKGESRSICHP